MNQVTALPPEIIEIGLFVNRVAEKAAFTLYQERRPENTQRSQRAALRVFSDFLHTLGLSAPDLYSDPFSWMGITWGIVQAFQRWLIKQGYSMKTVNDRVSVVKVYMQLANQAGIIPDGEILHLQALRGYTRKESIDMDSKRAKEEIPTRIGNKKQTATLLSDDQARDLCTIQNDTPQARRDAFMMCLLLDHGLRVSELTELAVQAIDLEARQMTFYRPKTGETARHNLRGRAWNCLIEYLKCQTSKTGPLFLASRKSGQLIQGKGLIERSVNDRVGQLGRAIGIEGLSPHDCRHYGATKVGHDPNVSLASLMAWGGWKSPQNAARYINKGEADNDGVSLGSE
jgi:integrase